MSRTARLVGWLEQRWYGGVAPGPGLRALAGLFGALAALRRMAFARGWFRAVRVDCPVIAIGNLTVGGAGKTPLALALATGLAARGWRPGIVSRGYGGRIAGPACVPADADPADYGDEPCLLARRSGVPVAIARRRAEAARLLRRDADVDVVIADDALQHLALARDVEILVVDGRRRFGNGLLMPAGPLREPLARGARCDFRVVNGGTPQPGETLMQLALDRAERLDGQGSRSLDGFRGEALNAVAGIADPQRFFVALTRLGLGVAVHPFPDHHPFAPSDFAFDDGRPLLMTEKDAVKCRAFARPNWYAVPAEPLLPDDFLDALDARLRAGAPPSPSPA